MWVTWYHSLYGNVWLCFSNVIAYTYCRAYIWSVQFMWWGKIPQALVMIWYVTCVCVCVCVSPCVRWLRTAQHCSSSPLFSPPPGLTAPLARSEPGWPSVQHWSHCLLQSGVYCYLERREKWGAGGRRQRGEKRWDKYNTLYRALVEKRVRCCSCNRVWITINKITQCSSDMSLTEMLCFSS